ncbi:MAG: hypothetical protein H7287_10830, partial [Thermoleophilia bacterium]|nr:hypothetical protein [Thermoleophilia bacterium]
MPTPSLLVGASLLVVGPSLDAAGGAGGVGAAVMPPAVADWAPVAAWGRTDVGARVVATGRWCGARRSGDRATTRRALGACVRCGTGRVRVTGVRCVAARGATATGASTRCGYDSSRVGMTLASDACVSSLEAPRPPGIGASKTTASTAAAMSDPQRTWRLSRSRRSS